MDDTKKRVILISHDRRDQIQHGVGVNSVAEVISLGIDKSYNVMEMKY
jgi:hypothetical protein